MRVRVALLEDATAIAAAEAETAAIPGMLVGRPGEIPLGAYRAKIAALEEKGRYIVAEDEGALVGHAFLDPMEMLANAHVFRLSIVVHPGRRGRGIGRALLHDLLAWASTDTRVRKVELLVRATNQPAIRLYRAVGFVEEGLFKRRVRRLDGTYIDDIAMAWFPEGVSAT